MLRLLPLILLLTLLYPFLAQGEEEMPARSLDAFARVEAAKALTLGPKTLQGHDRLKALLRTLAATSTGAEPFPLHGRADLSRHLTAGIGLGLNMDRSAALFIARQKENLDSLPLRSGFDLCDLAATHFGIYLIHTLRDLTDEEATAVIKAIAAGQLTLSQLSPNLKLTRYPTGQRPNEAEFKVVSQRIAKAWQDPSKCIYRVAGRTPHPILASHPSIQGLHRLGPNLWRGHLLNSDGHDDLKRVGIAATVEPSPLKASTTWLPTKGEAIDLLERLQRSKKPAILLSTRAGPDRVGWACALHRMVAEDWTRTQALREWKRLTTGAPSKSIETHIRTVDLNTLRRALGLKIALR
jgi:hypothetical protein